MQCEALLSLLMSSPMVILFQDPVQLGRAVDKGPEVYVDQPEVGPGLGVLSVHQQVTMHWTVIFSDDVMSPQGLFDEGLIHNVDWCRFFLGQI